MITFFEKLERKLLIFFLRRRTDFNIWHGKLNNSLAQHRSNNSTQVSAGKIRLY